MVTLIHEWLLSPGGSERVWNALSEMWPGARRLAGYGHAAESPDVRFSPLNHAYSDHVPFDIYRALSPWAIRSLGPIRDDLVVSDGHSGMMWARVDPASRWVHYCHTPARFIWRPDLLAGPSQRRSALAVFGSILRSADRRRASGPDLIIANSSAVQQRVKQFYRRESAIVHPPVDTDFFTPGGTSEGYYLIVSRLMAYKRIEEALAALSGTNLRVVIVGSGPERPTLERRFAAPNVSFVGRVSDDRLRTLYRGAVALVVPGEEDFCLAAVEAMACGTPVIGLAKGGLLDSVLDGQTGLLLPSMAPHVLRDACEQAGAISWRRDEIAVHSSSFSYPRFAARMHAHASGVAA